MDSHGLNVHVGFHLEDILVDGVPGTAVQKCSGTESTLYGSQTRWFHPENILIHWITTSHRELGFFPDDRALLEHHRKRLAFAIDRAEASVALPPGAVPGAMPAATYTGPSGSRGAVSSKREDAGRPDSIWTTRPLLPGEGLTIVAT